MATTLIVPAGQVTATCPDPMNYFHCEVPVTSTGAGGTYRCVKWRWFYVRCPKLNIGQCNAQSGAYVSAITVCNQQLWYNDLGQNQ